MTVAIGLYTKKGVTLYADRRMCISSEIIPVCKLHKAGKYHFALAGYGAAIQPISEFLRKNRPVEELRGSISFTSWTAEERPGAPSTIDIDLLVTDGDKLWRIAGDLVPNQVQTPYAAVGCGAEIALGALYAGAGPERALEITSELDARCGNGFDKIEVPRRRR